MSAWQIGLIVVGVLTVVAAVWAEFKGGRVSRRKDSQAAQEHMLESSIRNLNKYSGPGS